MWPFKKKQDDVEQFERELGLDTPKEESYDRLAKPGEEMSPPQMEYEAQKSLMESEKAAKGVKDSDTQLISAKLDTIKSMLELINQRLNNLEKHNEDKEKKKLW